MHYSDILAKFFEMFPNYQEKISQWGPRKGSTIKLKTHSGQSLEFTYFTDNDWALCSTNIKNRRN